MEYKALSQATYKFTTEVTINCNPLESIYTPKIGCVKYKKNNIDNYAQLIPCDTYTSNISQADLSSVSNPGYNTEVTSCTVDDKEYLGTKSSCYILASNGTTIAIKGKLTVIKYNSSSNIIETNVFYIDGSTSLSSSGYRAVIRVPKLSSDIILGITFEPAEEETETTSE